MRVRCRSLALICGLLVYSQGSAIGQTQQSPHTFKLDNPGNAAKAKIADLAWLQGRWVGTAFGGSVEEMWGAPLAGSMAGTFRLVKDGKVVFYEFCTLVEENGSVVLRLKHFHPNLKGWEEKDATVTFPVVRLSKDQVCFDGLTMQKETDGSLTMYLMIHTKNGETREETLHYRRE